MRGLCQCARGVTTPVTCIDRLRNTGKHRNYCPACEASLTETDSCDHCNNTGRVPTELGVELLEFLERHGIKSIAVEPPTATPGRE